MLLLLTLSCATDPDPGRLAQVARIADLDACAEPPDELRSLPLGPDGEPDPAEIRRRVARWADGGAAPPTRFPDDVVFELGVAWLQGWTEAPEAPAALVRSLDRCGNLTTEMLALAIGLTGCARQDAPFVRALPETSDPRAIAAREVLWQLALADLDDGGPYLRAQRRDLERTLVDWVLTEPFGPPTPIDARTLRPLASLMTTTNATVWADLEAKRAELAACRAAPASGVMVHERAMALFFPEDAVAALPDLAAWLAAHPGWHAVPAELDTPEVRGRLAATGCGLAATDAKGTVPWTELRWLPPDALGYDRETREALAVPEISAWALPLGPDAAAPWRVLSTEVPPAPVARCQLPEAGWWLQPTAVIEGADRYGTLAVPVAALGWLELEDATRAEVDAVPAGFVHAGAGHDALWDTAIERGLVRLLSPAGTVTRFVDRDGWWVTAEGERVWPRWPR
ncbi:MAG: hypothetical protein H6738_23370 [Alphaproteobacteria bacterium]|nr:hypothetical protein [Alphaproteobacteria bacterium]MCB9699746.1 hypothetical protein [Alphaproteobacteria bacterium]